MTLKPEQIAHINIINWFNHSFPELAEDMHHFANERYIKPTQTGSHWLAGRTLKRMGVKKGVSDFFLAFPQKSYAGLWIELKVGEGKLSKEQSEFLARKNIRGYCAMVAIDEKAAKNIILVYLADYIGEKIASDLPVCA